MNDTTIITGAAGFIGSHLAAALNTRGRRVIGIDNFDGFYARQNKLANLERATLAEFNEADIRDRDRMRAIFAQHAPAAVFHIAALAGVRPSIEDPARYAAVNLDGLVNVLDAAREANCRTVVFASSSSVYGNNSKVPFAETDPVDQPISPYAATKRAGELLCHTYAHLFGMRIAALRFFTVFGPSQRPDLAIMKFMRLIAAGEEVPMFGDGATSRDYTFIDDIVHGVLAAEQAIRTSRDEETETRRDEVVTPAHSVSSSLRLSVSPATQGFYRIWNLGGSHPHTLAEMIDVIAKVVGKPAKIKRLPMQPGDVERTWADLTRSKAELGFEPHTSFEDGVRKQWEWLRSTMRTSIASATMT